MVSSRYPEFAFQREALLAGVVMVVAESSHGGIARSAIPGGGYDGFHRGLRGL